MIIHMISNLKVSQSLRRDRQCRSLEPRDPGESAKEEAGMDGVRKGSACENIGSE